MRLGVVRGHWAGLGRGGAGTNDLHPEPPGWLGKCSRTGERDRGRFPQNLFQQNLFLALKRNRIGQYLRSGLTIQSGSLVDTHGLRTSAKWVPGTILSNPHSVWWVAIGSWYGAASVAKLARQLFTTQNDIMGKNSVLFSRRPGAVPSCAGPPDGVGVPVVL